MGIKDMVATIMGIDVDNLNTKRYGDIYEVLNNRSIKYTALVVELIRAANNGIMRQTTFRLSVVDKLNENESNVLDCFDHCERVLHDIVLRMEEEEGFDVESDYSIDFIKQEFADKCAGVYAEIVINQSIENCDYYGNPHDTEPTTGSTL